MRLLFPALLVLFLFFGVVFLHEFSAREYERLILSYNETTKEMNSVIKEYNDPSLLSVERVNLINKYLELHKKNTTGELLDFFDTRRSFILSLTGFEAENIKQELEAEEKRISVNLQGFQEDLERMNNSALIHYTEQTLKDYEELKQRIRKVND